MDSEEGTHNSSYKDLLDPNVEVAAACGIGRIEMLNKEVIVLHDGKWERAVVSTLPDRRGTKKTYTVQMNGVHGRPRHEFDLCPKDMHTKWVLVAPKPTPKLRTHTDADCAYNKKGMCQIVNNKDGAYGPGGKGSGVSDLDLRPCARCGNAFLHHICQTAAEERLEMEPELGHFCIDCLMTMTKRA